MEIAFFKAKCSSCEALFETPLLNDFSYGEFIARSKDGIFTAYLNAIEEPVVNEINVLFDVLFEEYGINLSKSSCFQYVIGKCSDMIEGQEMRLDFKPLCPYCGSQDCIYNDLCLVGRRDVEKLSFNSFANLDDNVKEELIKEYINEFSKVKK